MKIWYVSDLHQERLRAFEIPKLDKPDDADVLVVAGDLHSARQAPNWLRRQRDETGIPIIYVAGNHEFYGSNIHDCITYLREELQSEADIHFLEGDAVIVGNTRFVGGTLWTDFLLDGAGAHADRMKWAHFYMSDYDCIKTGRHRQLTPEDTARIHEKTRREFKEVLDWYDHEGPTVFVTHHMPHPDCCYLTGREGVLNAAYASDMSDFIERRATGPDLWLFGHGHQTVDKTIGNCRLMSNPRGYRDPKSENGWQNPGWDPKAMIDTDLLPRFQKGSMRP